MNPMKRKSDCPWTSTRKRKKQRKTTESISEHNKTTLAQSDKGSWFDQVKWLDEEELNASVSARKLCSEIDSDDHTEKRNNIVVEQKFAEWSDREVTASAWCFARNSKSTAAKV